MATLCRNNYRSIALSTQSISLWPSDIPQTQDGYGILDHHIHATPPAVRVAIDCHMSTIRENPDLSATHITRIVKTTKPDSAMGQGLCISHEPIDTDTSPDSSEPLLPAIKYEPAFPSLMEVQSMLNETRLTKQRRYKATVGDIILPVSDSDHLCPRYQLHPQFVGVDPELVPPELTAYNVDASTWRVFARAINAAVASSAQDTQTQIERWNRGVFSNLGFYIGLVSVNPGNLSLCII